jgi:excisionase family DNA binding protein
MQHPPMSSTQTSSLARPGGSGLASVKEAEKFLALSRATIYSLMDKGELRYVKIGKSRRIPWAAIDELVQKNTIAAA